MDVLEKTRGWFKNKKKYVLVGGTVVLLVVGTGAGYLVYKNNKNSFVNWLKTASDDILEDVYEKFRLGFCKTGIRTYEMEQIGRELGERDAKKWFEICPPNLDPNFRWTDENRWAS